MTVRRLSAEKRRGQLIAAAIASIARYGLKGCSINAITNAAGVSRGLIHHYFRSKDELLAEAYGALGESMMDVMQRIANEEGQTAVGRLHAVIRAAFVPPVSSATNASAWLAFWHAARNDPRLRAINRRIYADYRDLMTKLVRDAASELGSEVDVAEVVSTLVSLMDGAWIELAIDSDSNTPEASSLAYVRLIMEH